MLTCLSKAKPPPSTANTTFTPRDPSRRTRSLSMSDSQVQELHRRRDRSHEIYASRSNGTAFLARQVSMRAAAIFRWQPDADHRITGTPVIDAASKTLYFDAHTSNIRHISTRVARRRHDRAGCPSTSLRSSGFNSQVQSQRGALALVANALRCVRRFGDCGSYKGWSWRPTATPRTQVVFDERAEERHLGPGELHPTVPTLRDDRNAPARWLRHQSVVRLPSRTGVHPMLAELLAPRLRAE